MLDLLSTELLLLVIALPLYKVLIPVKFCFCYKILWRLFIGLFLAGDVFFYLKYCVINASFSDGTSVFFLSRGKN